MHAYVNVIPNFASLTISARMKATNLKIGKEGWHTARIAMSFEGGAFGYPAEVPELRTDSDWVTRSVELTVPKGATRLNIQPAMFYCTGVFEISDLTVTPHMLVHSQTGDAVLPAGIALNWDKAKVKAVNAKCAEVSLDGIWRFTPATEGTAEPPKRGWAYIKVPGEWQIHPGKPSDFLALAGGPRWDLYDGTSVARAVISAWEMCVNCATWSRELQFIVPVRILDRQICPLKSVESKCPPWRQIKLALICSMVSSSTRSSRFSPRLVGTSRRLLTSSESRAER